jgi:hypothetical protein
MAVLLSDQNHFNEAEALYDKVYRSFQANYGEDDSQTKKAKFNLVTFLRKKNENIHNEAIRGHVYKVSETLHMNQDSDRKDPENFAHNGNGNDGFSKFIYLCVFMYMCIVTERLM